VKSQLHLFNTLSRKKEIFRSGKKEKVKMFTCGPSTYSRAHVGNYRTFLYEDILQNYLEKGGWEVDRMMNLTDVEDKAIAEAREQGVDLGELTGNVERKFLEEARMLGIRVPDFLPRASECVGEAANLIKTLLEKGHAYWHGRDVFFDPLTVEGFGRLYGLDMDRWPKKKKRFRKDTYPGQRWNLGDFILWHGSNDDEISWETDIGEGRPSWNIQDPAMIARYLGTRIDIACGGIDNLYRHHDYTLAVMESAFKKPFARYWLHGEHVLADGKKMSKSKGNITYLEDLVRRGYGPRYVRFFLIYGHYRRTLDLTEAAVEKTTGMLFAFKNMVHRLLEVTSARTYPDAREGVRVLGRVFRERMNDDLDVKGAFDALREGMIRLMSLYEQERFGGKDAAALRGQLEDIDGVLQVLDLS
jgi:cysteinyl-tRNA synthetase